MCQIPWSKLGPNVNKPTKSKKHPTKIGMYYQNGLLGATLLPENILLQNSLFISHLHYSLVLLTGISQILMTTLEK